MTTAVIDRPMPTTEMGRTEAEAVTQAIKDNFDSLGSMLIQARDRKAYKALGYRTFEGYCKTEFGKSISSAYRLIEDAKVVAQLESEIAKQYDEPITLNIPSAYLRLLKEIPDVSEKLRAIEYAKKLATAEGKKPTKKHLEIAVFEISGKRSEDFRNAIQSLGFTKGVSVEVVENLSKDRGLITRVDKLGKIYVQFHNGVTNSIPFDAADLRILADAEKPATPLNEITASKGDRVLIFARCLTGKTGTIYQWKEGRQALVTVDGESVPMNIAYAEMELVRDEQQEANWDSELVWNAGKNTYYYFPREDTIYSDNWPQGLALKPHSHEKSPIEFIKNWEDKFASDLLEALVTPERLKTLALAQAIQLPEAEGKEFAADLVASLLQLFPQKETNETTALLIENEQLREQLAEAESAIQAIVNAASTSSTLASPETTDFLVENAASTASTLASPETSDFLVENAAEISAPGDTAAHPDFLVENTAEISAPEESLAQPELPPELANQINSVRDKFLGLIQKYEKTKSNTSKKKDIENLNDNIDTLQKKLENLEKFEQLRIGHTICHQRRAMVLGKIIGLEFTQGEMPIVWVKYYEEGNLQNTPTTEIVRMIFVVDV